MPHILFCRSVFLHIAFAISYIAISLLLFTYESAATSRIKDIVDFEGVRENQLVGYGLVVGLNGTGDSLNNSPFTRQSLTSMLERLGVNTRGNNLSTKNVAAVMVTANLPPFAMQGSRIDVNVSALGDSNSLQGGTLLVTPLLGADGRVYAVAQGGVSIGGFDARGNASSITRGVPTAGRIASGALIEEESKFALAALDEYRLSLRTPDFTTARRITDTINDFMGFDIATMVDPSTVKLTPGYKSYDEFLNMITDIEQLRVETDTPAKVVVDENSGIVVIGEDVRVSEVAVAQGNLTVSVSEAPIASQPNAFSNTGQTVTLPRTKIKVSDDNENRLSLVGNGVSLKDLVDGLNALGVGPRDLISILQAIKAAGALQAEIEVM